MLAPSPHRETRSARSHAGQSSGLQGSHRVGPLVPDPLNGDGVDTGDGHHEARDRRPLSHSGVGIVAASNRRGALPPSVKR